MHGVFYGHVKCVPVAHPALAEWGLSCTFRLVLAVERTDPVRQGHQFGLNCCGNARDIFC